MVRRFVKINDNLYRGSQPSVKDVVNLHKIFNIKKIVSLDESAGERINRICKLLNIEHIVIPINRTKIEPLVKLLSYDLYNLLMENGPTFVHCIEGKDRTGMVIAMFKCKYMDWSFKEAIEEARSLGFGIGLDPSVTKTYEKVICMFCKKNDHSNKDNNNANIIENMRDDQIDREVNMPSFAPFMDSSRQYPHNHVYDYKYDVYPTRENRDMKIDPENKKNNSIPLVGLYDNDAGIKGVGPVENGGGFVN